MRHPLLTKVFFTRIKRLGDHTLTHLNLVHVSFGRLLDPGVSFPCATPGTGNLSTSGSIEDPSPDPPLP